MNARGMRAGLIAGAVTGVIAALCILLIHPAGLPLLIGAALAVVAGALAAYLWGRAPADLAAAPPGWRATRWGAGLTGGVVMGLCAAVALTISTYQLVNTDEFRAPMASLFSQAGAGSGADSVTAVVMACSGCFFLLIIPTATAGLAAIGAWLMGLAQPAAPPAMPPTLTGGGAGL
jgi:hypothetical protein